MKPEGSSQCSQGLANSKALCDFHCTLLEQGY